MIFHSMIKLYFYMGIWNTAIIIQIVIASYRIDAFEGICQARRSSNYLICLAWTGIYVLYAIFNAIAAYLRV
jgi:hypothetical protein